MYGKVTKIVCLSVTIIKRFIRVRKYNIMLSNAIKFNLKVF